MSSPFNKKRRESRIATRKSIIVVKHEREGNLNYYSEEIIRKLIDKLISNAISASYVQNIEKSICKYCFNIIQKQINNVLQLVKVNRDKDDFDIYNFNISSYITNQKSDLNNKRYKLNLHNYV